MSFQFFSRLDNTFTDGPVSQLDPDRGMRNVAQGGGDIGRAVQAQLNQDKDQKRLARRAYRKAMRSGSINEMAAASQMLDAAGGRFLTPGAQQRIAERELESRGMLGSFPNRMGERRGLGFGQQGADQTNQQAGGAGLGLARESFAEIAERKARESTESGAFGTRAANNQVGAATQGRMDFADDLRRSHILNNRSKYSQAEFETARAQAYKRADQMGISREKIDQEMGWDLERESKSILANDAELVRSEAEAVRIESERRQRLGLDDFSKRDEILGGLEKSKNEARSEMDRRKEADSTRDSERKARMDAIEAEEQQRIRDYGDIGPLEQRGIEGAAAAAEIERQSVATKDINQQQAQATASYLDAAELEWGVDRRITDIALINTFADHKSPFKKTSGSPFLPHGIMGGEIQQEAIAAGNPEVYKKALDTGRAFNEALGGREITVKYKDKGFRTLADGTRVRSKIRTIRGQDSVTFQEDAFSAIKNQALINMDMDTPEGRKELAMRGGSESDYQPDDNGLPKIAVEAMDKIVKAAVENKYPIELDGELMAVPLFREKLHTARVKNGMKTNAKGYLELQI
jgi:hypothetical protein